MKCTQCGKEIAETASFCPWCGSAVSSKEKKCWKCQTILQEGIFYCPSCGEKQNEELNSIEENIIQEQEKTENKSSEEKSFSTIQIDAKDSGYNFRKIREIYHQKGNIIEESMYKLGTVEIVTLVIMGGILLLLLLDGGFNYFSIRRVYFTIIVFGYIIYAVFYFKGKVMNGLGQTSNEEICRAIIEMDEQEIELRESRKNRDLVASIISTIIFIGIEGNREIEGYSWGENFIMLVIVFLITFVLVLPLSYYRHRATRRLQNYLATKQAIQRGIEEAMKRQ